MQLLVFEADPLLLLDHWNERHAHAALCDPVQWNQPVSHDNLVQDEPDFAASDCKVQASESETAGNARHLNGYSTTSNASPTSFFSFSWQIQSRRAYYVYCIVLYHVYALLCFVI